ncbi:MAG TPA: phosphate ABC transporter permease PstA [Candidatus Polarisedimenticolaceae bacterium]|nr:phosphate ABC transporter permease PstA [Candidatus Polarisedimenticolaceae bacterium]
MKTRRRPSPAIGRILTWLTGGTLALNLLLILGLLALLMWNGAGTFWPRPLLLLTLKDGGRVLGELRAQDDETAHRVQLKIGNREITGADFKWFDEAQIGARALPANAILLERLEWGNFFGFFSSLKHGSETTATGDTAVAAALPSLLAAKHEEARTVKALELEASGSSERFAALSSELDARRAALAADVLVMTTASGETRELPVSTIVRMLRPNTMGAASKIACYASRVREFLLDPPRESNTEGGIFPAIFGTVMMVFLMSFAVLPLGVLAALYLREYARQGALVRAVRIAVNNLAGVPSIVFGVFGLGFFVYFVGGGIDRTFFADRLPTPTFGTGGILWAALTLALLTVPVVIVATEEGLAAVPRGVREGSLALGATKLETIVRVVLPASAPGILTGMILAMARAAGEVAPLMIVGMVKLAPALPVDGTPPFVHLERKFMHLGFHIYDVGFQSPNVEATKPLVFATALLLIGVVTVVNLAAIVLRNRLRRKYATSAV